MYRRILIVAGVLMLSGLFFVFPRAKLTPAIERGGYFTRTADGKGVDWNITYDATPKR
jgi:hypothetical protein